MGHKIRTGLAIVAAMAMSSAAYATTMDFSFTGTFAGDAEVQQFNFTIGATSNVTLRSYSYAGGTMADGTIVAAGGFDPILALWDSLGNLVGEFDDGPETVPVDPATGAAFDTNLILLGLTAGSYTATITQFSNFALGTNLSQGFQQSGATFTSGFGCSNGQFCDFTGNNRSNFWAFDVLGVDSAVAPPSGVPVPAGLPLLLSGLFGFGLLARRRKSA